METSFQSRGEVLRATLYGDSQVGVVLCPPHPLYGGSKNDPRIVRVARALASNGVSALCLDYGSYGNGVSEVENVLDAVSFFGEKVHSVGLFGYSFGAVVASEAAVRTAVDGLAVMSILRKVNGLELNLNSGCPKLFVHGRFDNVAPYLELEKIYVEAKGRKEKLVLDTDHFFMEKYPAVMDLASDRICRFFRGIFFK